MRTSGDYVHFSLPDFKYSYKVYKYDEESGNFTEAFFGTKKKPSEEKEQNSTSGEGSTSVDKNDTSGGQSHIAIPTKEQVHFLDAVFSEDLVVLLLRD